MMIDYRIQKNNPIEFDYEFLLKKEKYPLDEFNSVDAPQKLTTTIVYHSNSSLNRDKLYSIPEMREKVKHLNFFDIAFSAVAGMFTHCAEMMIFFGGNHPYLPHKTGVGSHLHPPNMNGDVCRTVTVIVPIKIVQEIKETLRCQLTEVTLPLPEHFDYVKSYTDKNLKREYVKNFILSAKSAKKNPILEFKFPGLDEIAILDFHSSHYIHWVENFSENNFLMFVFDDCYPSLSSN